MSAAMTREHLHMLRAMRAVYAGRLRDLGWTNKPWALARLRHADEMIESLCDQLEVPRPTARQLAEDVRSPIGALFLDPARGGLVRSSDGSDAA